jgi:hypothetical protein
MDGQSRFVRSCPTLGNNGRRPDVRSQRCIARNPIQRAHFRERPARVRLRMACRFVLYNQQLTFTMGWFSWASPAAFPATDLTPSLGIGVFGLTPRFFADTLRGKTWKLSDSPGTAPSTPPIDRECGGFLGGIPRPTGGKLFCAFHISRALKVCEIREEMTCRFW